MSGQTDKSEWNSLEIAKLLVGILTPLSILYFTNTSEHSRDTEAALRASAALMETDREARYSQVTKKRVDLWGEISPRLNDIYCYFLYVGHWKSLTPADVLKAKRDADKSLYSNLPFFSPRFIAEYQDFMNQTFRTGNGWKKNARFRTSPIRDMDSGPDVQFTGEDNTTKIFESYFRLLKVGGEEMDLNVIPNTIKPQTPSADEVEQQLRKGLAAKP